jgi:DNA-binding protein H-NS
MNIEELKAAKEKLAEIERETLADITAKAQLLGYELVKASSSPHPDPDPVPKPVAKYRSPSGEEWTGRGKRPAWLKAALENGATLETFEVR